MQGQQIVEDFHLLKDDLISICDAHAHEVEHAANKFTPARGMLQLAGDPVPAVFLNKIANIINTQTDDTLEDLMPLRLRPLSISIAEGASICY